MAGKREVIRDVQRFLGEHSRRSLLRFSTVGSVDDGKSTLIGRLLHDSKNLLEDQIVTLKGESKQSLGDAPIDFALVTDGLKAEREQGITIDVAYRYFSTPKRNFIIADTPGHEQYTRNMATGASTANLAIILIDAAQGVLTQTKRHSFIASLLGIPRLLIAVNKMDLVDYSQEVYDAIVEDYSAFAVKLGIVDLKFIPISALRGDNVVDPSDRMPWYHGETVLEYLETVYIGSDRNLVDFRFPVQYVLRPDRTFRGFAGQVASGSVRVGEELLALPSMRRSRVKAIHVEDREIEEAFSPQSVVLTLTDEVDVSRGDMLVRVNNVPHIEDHFEAMLVWMSEVPMDPTKTYLIKQTTKKTKASIQTIRYRIDVNTLHRATVDRLDLNDIGRVAFRTHHPLFFDSYKKNKATGSFILIDALSNATVAAGMIIDRVPADQLRESDTQLAGEVIRHGEGAVTQVEREATLGQKAVTLWFTGLSGSGKTTIASAVERRLFGAGKTVYHIDDDALRSGLSRDLGPSRYDGRENTRRAAEVARLFNDAGAIVLVSVSAPFRDVRQGLVDIIGRLRFAEIYLRAPLEVCRERDRRGAGEPAGGMENLSDTFEEPESPALTLDTATTPVEECVERVLALIGKMIG